MSNGPLTAMRSASTDAVEVMRDKSLEFSQSVGRFSKSHQKQFQNARIATIALTFIGFFALTITMLLGLKHHWFTNKQMTYLAGGLLADAAIFLFTSIYQATKPSSS